MYHQPQPIRTGFGAIEKDTKFEILHLEDSRTPLAPSNMSFIPVNKKCALTCSKEDTKSILTNRGERCLRNRSQSLPTSAIRFNSFLKQVFKPVSPNVSQQELLAQERAAAERAEAEKRGDPTLKVSFGPLPSRDTKCKVVCGVASRASMLGRSNDMRAVKYTGPKPKMPIKKDDGTGLSRRSSAIEARVFAQEQAGPGLGRRHTTSEIFPDEEGGLFLRGAPIRTSSPHRSPLTKLHEEEDSHPAPSPVRSDSKQSSIMSEWTTTTEEGESIST